MYGKIYESTFTGSMVGSGSDVFAVWGYVIANTKPDSMVELNPILIGAMLGEEPAAMETAIAKLCEEDTKSRSKNHRGCRLIKRGEFLYFVPNHQKYRGLPNDSERKQYFAMKQRERRQRLKDCQTTMSKSVKLSPTSRSISRSNKDVGANGSRPASDVWLSQLAKDPTYEGIDVTREFGKMQNWCKIHGKQPTERRFINWLNRTDRPVKPPKPASPVYGRNPLPPAHELSEEERQRHLEIARRAKEQLSKKLREPF